MDTIRTTPPPETASAPPAGTTTPAPTPAHTTRGERAVQIVLLAGAGLVMAAGLVLLGGYWGGFTLALRVSIAAAGAVALGAAAFVVATRRPGARALRSTDFHTEHEGRRMLTAVLSVAAAAMTAFTIFQFPTETGGSFNGPGDFVPAQPTWVATIALGTALAIALVAAWAAPGVVTTLAVSGFTAGTAIAVITTALWQQEDASSLRVTLWMAIAFTTIGLLGSLVASRWLRPAILTVALSVFAWFFGGLQAATEGEQMNDAPLGLPQAVMDQAAITGWVGRASLAALIVVGITMFLRGGPWPWPAGAVAALVALTLVMTANTLGVAAALLITGVLLLLAAGGIFWVMRRRAAALAESQPAGTG